MIAQFLPLRRLGTEKRAAGEDQIAAPVEQILVYEEVFLFGTDGGRDAGGVHPAEQMQNSDGLPVQRLHGTEERRFLVQRFAAPGTVRRRDAEDMILNESIGSRIPGGVAPGLKGGTQTAVGQGRSIRLAADQFLAGKLLDDRSAGHGADKCVVLFGGDGIQGLEPVGVMGGAPLQGPVLHCVGNDAGDLRIQTAAFVDGFMQGFVGFLRKALAHDRIVKYVDSEKFFHRGHGKSLLYLCDHRFHGPHPPGLLPVLR